MDLDFQRVLLKRLFDLRAQRTTTMAPAVRLQSTTTYTDAGQLAREEELLFRRRPLVVCVSGDVARPGDYVTADVGGTPVLVVRNEAGFITAFVNACRHRGSPVASGAGNAGRVFKCPYHAWTYGADGRLLGQPEGRDGFTGCDAEDFSLLPLPAAEAGGLVWVHPDRGGAPIDGAAELAGLEPELRDHGFDRLVPFAQHETTWSMNWKHAYETFLETYHVFALHRDTLARELMSTPMLADFFGPHGRGVLMGRAAPRLLEVDESEWRFRRHAGLLYWLFPNTVLNMPSTGHAELWQFAPVDGSTGRARVSVRFSIPEDENTEDKQDFWQRVVDFTLQVVTTEDFPQQERISHGVESGQVPRLVFGRNEPALIHFHESLDAALGIDSTAALPTSP